MDHRFTQSIARVYAVVKSLEMGETMARSYDLTSGSIPQHLLRLTAPLIMGTILQQLYNTVDAFILGRFAGELEFAAGGVAGHFGGAVHPLPAAQGTGAHLCSRGLPYGWRAIEADGTF